MAKVVKLSEQRKAAQKKARAANRPAPAQQAKLAWLVISAVIIIGVLFWQPIWDLLT